MATILLLVSIFCSAAIADDRYERLLAHGYDDYKANRALTGTQIQALAWYQSADSSGYVGINSLLRNALPDELKPNRSLYEKAIEQIDGALSSVKRLPNDLVVYRGTNYAYRGDIPYRPGEIFQDLAYVSTSTLKRKADLFGGESGNSKTLMMITFCPRVADTWKWWLKRFSVPGILMGQFEAEILLKRGLYFKVFDLKPNAGGYRQLLQACETRADLSTKLPQAIYNEFNGGPEFQGPKF